MFTEGRKGRQGGGHRPCLREVQDLIIWTGYTDSKKTQLKRREDPQAVQAESAVLSGQDTQRTEATAAAAGIRVVGEQSGGGAGALREEVTPMPTVLLTALSAVSLEQWGWGVPQALACSPPSAQPNNSAVRAPQSPFPARIIPWPITSSCAHPCQQNCPLQGRRC